MMIGAPQCRHAKVGGMDRFGVWEQAESALARMRAWVNANGLTLHPEKTHLGDYRVEGQGSEFLGCRFEAGRRCVRKI